MPTLSITKTYLNGNTLSETDLDNIKNSIETFINTTKLDSSNIQASGIALSNLAANSVDETKIATSVAGDGLAGGGGTALSVNVDASTIEINTDIVRVKDLGITTAKLANLSVTAAKKEALNYTIGSSTGHFTSTSTGFASVTGLSATLTTNGRPVLLFFQSSGNSAGTYLRADQGSNFTAIDIRVVIDGGAVIAQHTFTATVGGSSSVTITTPSNFTHLHVPAAGSHTYTVEVRCASGGGGVQATIENTILVAVEL